jgi:prepilin-type N-terminal cleavage/methylation domain-containing protein
MNHRKGFTLFEVLIALGVFAIAATGLAMALKAVVDGALAARQRMAARHMIESQLAASYANPPMEGVRELAPDTNGGIRLVETMEPAELTDMNGVAIPGMWKLRIVATWLDSNEEAEVLVFRP